MYTTSIHVPLITRNRSLLESLCMGLSGSAAERKGGGLTAKYIYSTAGTINMYYAECTGMNSQSPLGAAFQSHTVYRNKLWEVL